MSLSIIILSCLTFISAGIAIYTRQVENIKQYSFFKPLTTLLIIGIAVFIYYNEQNQYSLTIIIALIFALIGDIFLIGKEYFIYGLLSFLITHLLFIYAFINISDFHKNLYPLLILLFIGAIYYFFLFKNLKTYQIPVLIYLIVILVMNWQAINLFMANNNLVHFTIVLAGLLFGLSDGIIAYSKFINPFKYSEILILSTYWIAIYIFTIAGLYIK